MDRKTKKIMAMNRMYYPQRSTARLYIPKMKCGRGLVSIADGVETEEASFFLYLGQSEEKLMRYSKSERIFPEYEEPISIAKSQKKEERHKQWKEKQINGKSVLQTEEIRREEI